MAEENTDYRTFCPHGVQKREENGRRALWRSVKVRRKGQQLHGLGASRPHGTASSVPAALPNLQSVLILNSFTIR